jgi:hypothetical protein
MRVSECRKTTHDRKWIFSRFDQQGVGGVAKAVESDVGEFRLPEQWFEEAFEEWPPREV